MAAPGRLVFLGSPSFAVPTLRALAQHGYELPLVVTQPDRPAGRGGRLQSPAVKVAAQELGLEVYQPETLRGEPAHKRLASAGADAFVVTAYGRILSRAVLAIPTAGCVNVHASLLPRWRGASPVAAAILAGDPVTGVSIMELEPKMDAGPVIARREEPIRPLDTGGELEARLALLGAEALVQALPAWLAGGIEAEPQDESQATYCRLLTKEDGHLRKGFTAAEAERAVRAYDPWPGTYVIYSGKRLAIWRAAIVPGACTVGATAVIEGQPAIGFGDGWLLLLQVQKPGGKRLDGRTFLNGEQGRFTGQVGLND